MKKFWISFFLFIFILGADISHAQRNIQTESQLAFKHFRDQEYKPASVIFFNLFKITKSKTYFNYYIESLVRLKQYQDAEKSIKKQFKKNPLDNSLLIALGYVYKESGELEKSNNQYKKVLKSLSPVKGEIIHVANAFISKREYEFANKTYERGRILLKRKHLFHLEMANVYQYLRDFEKMVEEYLMAIEIDPGNVTTVQNRLQSALLQDFNSSLDEILKNQLLSKIQSNAENIAFRELLQWYFVQKKQFKSALRQARSIDLIRNEDGFRLLALAYIAQNNKDFETAIECYRIVVEKGKASPNYLRAKMGELETQYIVLSEKGLSSQKEWQELSNRYEQFLEEEDKHSQIPATLIQHAHIKTFYLNEKNEAVKILEDALKIRGMHPQNQSKIKMELADIKLFANEKWDAILLYAQIEKANKNNPIGFEAKFKKAKVSYYMGELKWAKAQFDAVKSSTSKLIANDALALSQLISDNTTLDTSYTAMKIYAEAEFLLYQQRDSLALQKLDDLLKNHSAHSLSDEVYFKKYEIFLQNRQEDKAVECLKKIIAQYPKVPLAAKALLKQGEFYEKRSYMGKATDSYKAIITQYPESIHSVEARKKLENLR